MRPLRRAARPRYGWLAAALTVAVLLCAPPRAALAESHCRVSLLLALDVSASVDVEEYVLQRDGLAAALLAPDIRAAILEGPGEVALSAYEWSGRQQQSVILPWRILRSEADILSAAQTIAGADRSHSAFPTAAGYALGYGAGLMRRAPQCDRRVIDVSGDGVNNEGFGPALAYANFPFAGVVVNGLAILGPDEGVLDFYNSELRYGPGAFVIVANGFEDFQEAMTRKLYRELKELQVGSIDDGASRPRAPDLVDAAVNAPRNAQPETAGAGCCG